MRDAATQLQTTGQVVLGDATMGVIHTQKRVNGLHFMVHNIINNAFLKLDF